MAEVIVELPREALSLSEVANVSGLGRTLIGSDHAEPCFQEDLS